MNITLNLQNDVDRIRDVEAGSSLLLSGKLLVARDAVHKKIIDLVNEGKELPCSLQDRIIYYMGPSPARPGYPIGSCGPTSSYRMDDMLEPTLKLGIAATIGKGDRAPFVNDLAKKYRTPYLLAIGGAAAYLAECVISSKIIAFEELGAEAMRELEVKNFPVITVIDSTGKSVF